MSDAPFYYNQIMMNNGSTNPSTVHIRNTATHNYFKKYLLQRCIGVFDWTLPKNWDKRYFLYTLYQRGWLCVINTDKFGIIPQMCGLQGFNVFYEPRTALIQNPLFHPVQAVIHKDTELIRLQPDYSSIMDIVNTYADKLTLAFQSVDINLLNSHLSYVFFAKNKATAESYKSLYDSIAAGNPATVIDKNLMDERGNKTWDVFSRDLKSNYLVTDLLSDIRKIMNMFDNEVGIPNANTEKKERQIVDEINANNEETMCLSDLWLEMLQEDLERVRKMFGYTKRQLNVKRKKVSTNERQSEVIDTRNV